MNELESEAMLGVLQKRGLTRTFHEHQADLLIFHTCSVRDLAERKVMGKIGLLSRRSGSPPIVGVTGCMAASKKETLFRKLPCIQFILGPRQLGQLDVALDEIERGQRHVMYVNENDSSLLDYGIAEREQAVRAYVSIIQGCDKFCTYCIVPHTRGREVSRPLEEIVSECSRLVDKGYKEVILLGQNVNSYGKDFTRTSPAFHHLLEAIDRVEGIERIRFLTSHPVDISPELMDAMRDLPSVCEELHFPVQSGSNRILKKMHRLYSLEEYREKVAQLRERIPDIRLGTDMIVGFPTESEADFEQSVQIMEEIQYGLAFLYAYSPRKGTPAIKWPDDVPEPVKQERLQRLLQLHRAIRARQLRQLLGSTQEVLVEKKNREGWSQGKTRTGEKAIFQSDQCDIGSLCQIQIESYSSETLIGKKEESHE